MKATALSAALAISGLMATSGTVLAGGTDPAVATDPYTQFFYNSLPTRAERSDAMGKAAYGAAETRPFVGPKGGIMVPTGLGTALWSPGPSSTGMAAFGSGGSNVWTGHDAYHRALTSD